MARGNSMARHQRCGCSFSGRAYANDSLTNARVRWGMRRKPNSGFTLIELSIVLVIIGLLVGGVLVGRDLIMAAEIRSVVSIIDGTRYRQTDFQIEIRLP